MIKMKVICIIHIILCEFKTIFFQSTYIIKSINNIACSPIWKRIKKLQIMLFQDSCQKRKMLNNFRDNYKQLWL